MDMYLLLLTHSLFPDHQLLLLQMPPSNEGEENKLAKNKVKIGVFWLPALLVPSEDLYSFLAHDHSISVSQSRKCCWDGDGCDGAWSVLLYQHRDKTCRSPFSCLGSLMFSGEVRGGFNPSDIQW